MDPGVELGLERHLKRKSIGELVPLSRELGRRVDTTLSIAVGAGVVMVLGLLTSA